MLSVRAGGNEDHKKPDVRDKHIKKPMQKQHKHYDRVRTQLDSGWGNKSQYGRQMIRMIETINLPPSLTLVRSQATYYGVTLPCQNVPKKAPAFDTISTALPTSVPSSNTLTVVGLGGGLRLTMPLAATGTTVTGEEGCGGGTGSEAFMLRIGEFAGVGCLDIWSCSSALPLDTAMGVDSPEPNSSSSMATRSGLLLSAGTAVEAADTVDEPEEVEEDGALETARFVSPNLALDEA